jgi:hypothetical protein
LGRAGDHRRFSAIESLSESDLLKCVDRPLKSNDSESGTANHEYGKHYAAVTGIKKGQLVGHLQEPDARSGRDADETRRYRPDTP